MKSVLKVLVFVFIAMTCAACATSFTGSAFVEDGRGGCETKCREQGLEFVGMVFMGEYSDACVCGAPGKVASRERELAKGVAAVAGGTGGVVMQTRRAQQNQQKTY